MTTAAPSTGSDTTDEERTVTWGEFAALLIALGVGLTAWASLALAQFGAHDLPAVALVTGIALAVCCALAWRYAPRPQLRFNLVDVVLVGIIGLVSIVMYAPGFPYAYADKDPGLYVSHGMAISREGGLSYPDEIAAAEGVEYDSIAGGRFPGLWADPNQDNAVLPQFYHQWPALLGTTADIGGFWFAVNLTPRLAVLATVILVLAIRRGVGRRHMGTAAALLGGLLLATNMLQVWQAKYPTTEVLAQLYLAGATLAVVVALRSRWAPAAAVGGLLTSLTFQVRPDGILLVLLAVAIGAAIYAFERWDRRVTWFAIGLAVPLPTALYQAYWLSERYTLANGIPSLPTVTLLVAVLVGGAIGARWMLNGPLSAMRARLVDWGPPGRSQLLAGGAIVAGYGVLLLLAWFRPSLLGEDFFPAPSGELVRSFNEDNLLRLSWFFTPLGLVLMWAGLCVVALRRWEAAAWALVVPGTVFLPIYLWNAKISPRLMWWGRRFIPIAILAIVVLIAIALAWALTRRGRWRLPLAATGAAASVFLIASQLGQSWPLRSHSEFKGSFEVIEAIAEPAGDEQALFIWVEPYRGIFTPKRNLGGPLWLIEDQLSVLLPGSDEGEPRDDLVEAYAMAFPDERILLVADADGPPPGFDPGRLTQVARINRNLPLWSEGPEEVPTSPHANGVWVDLSIWEWAR